MSDLKKMCEGLIDAIDSMNIEDILPRTSNVSSKQKEIKVNFSSKRFSTTWKLLICALQMLFTGKTTIKIKKR